MGSTLLLCFAAKPDKIILSKKDTDRPSLQNNLFFEKN